MFFKTLINTWRSWTICLCTIFQDLDFWRDFLTISDEQQLLIYYLESLVPIVLGTFQSARNFGHWKVYHFRSRISTGIYGTLRIFTALLRSFLQQKMQCLFLLWDLQSATKMGYQAKVAWNNRQLRTTAFQVHNLKIHLPIHKFSEWP